MLWDGKDEMMKRGFFLRAVWWVLYVLCFPVATVFLVARGSRGLDILDWPEEVCRWLEGISLFNLLLVVASVATMIVAVNLIWSAWHINHKLFPSFMDRVGCTIAGLFIYFAGLTLFFIAIWPKKNITARKLLSDIFQ